jgi:hypothetical protein
MLSPLRKVGETNLRYFNDMFVFNSYKHLNVNNLMLFCMIILRIFISSN